MANLADKEGEKKPPPTIYIKILVFFGLIGLSFIIMRPVQAALSLAVGHVQASFIRNIENITGLEVRYASIRPTFFNSLDIRNFNLIKNDNILLSIHRARFSFSLIEIIRGNRAAIHTVQIETPRISIDLDRDDELLRFLSSLGAESFELSRIAVFFPDNPYFKIRDCFINITAGSESFTINNLNIDITGNSEILSFNGEFAVEYNFSLFNRTVSVKTEVAVTGESCAGLENGSARLVVSYITGTEVKNRENNSFLFRQFANLRVNEIVHPQAVFEVRPLYFDILFTDGLLSLTAQENNSFNFLFNFNFNTGGINTAFEAQNFLPLDFVQFSPSYNKVTRLFSLPVTGGAYFNYLEGSFEYNVNFFGGNTAQNPRETNDSFLVRVSGNDKTVSLDDLRLFSSRQNSEPAFFYGEIALSLRAGLSPFSPSGLLSLNDFNLNAGRSNDAVNAVFNIEAARNEIILSGKNILIGRSTLEYLNFYFLPSADDLGIYVSALSKDEGRIDVSATYIFNPNQLDISLGFNDFSLFDITQITSPFLRTAHLPGFLHNSLRNSFVNADIFITTDFGQILYHAPNMVVDINDVTASLSFSGTDRRFNLNESVISANGNDFIFSSHFNFANPMDMDFVFNANYHELSWNIEGQFLDRNTLIIRDPNGLFSYGGITNTGVMAGYLEGVNFPIPFNGTTVYLNFYISMRHTSRDFWFVDVAHFNAANSNANNEDFFRVSGILDQDGANFRDIALRDNVGFLTGNLDLLWDSNFSNIQFSMDITDGNETGEKYFVEGAFDDNNFFAQVSLADVRIDRFMAANIPITANLDAQINWDSENIFDMEFNIESVRTLLNNNPFFASASLRFDNDQFEVNDFWLEYAQMTALIQSFQICRIENYLNASAALGGFLADRVLGGEFNFYADFMPIDSWAEITHAFSYFNGFLSAQDFRYGNNIHEPFIFNFSHNRGALSLAGGPRDMINLEMDNDGNFFASLSSPLPIRTTVIGNFSDGFINARSNDFFMDISSLWDLIPPVQNFNITGGFITGTVDIKGPVLNPQFFGSARGTSLRLQVPEYISQDIRPVPFNAVLEGNELTFGPVSTAVGAGGGTVSGWLRFENWIPRDAGLDIFVPRTTPIPYTANITGFLAQGDASGRLLFNFERNIVELTGELFVNNTEMGLNIDELRFNSDRDFEFNSNFSVIANLTITTGSTVEFIWPNTNMPILRANPEMGTVVEVFADTRSRQFLLNSDIAIRSGELSYFDRTFIIRRGNLVFRENETRFDPRLSARAEIRDRTDSGPVTISMVIENEPLLSFTPRFEANPALTQLEIYSLLGHNIHAFGGSEDPENIQRMMLSSTADIITQLVGTTDLFGDFSALRQFERFVRNSLGLDMFSIRTRVIQNVVLTNVPLGIEQVDRNNRVGNYFDNTSVFIGRYVGQSMFIQGMLSMRYDENNLAFNSIRIEPDIGIELQSPLFSIRWDFFPYSPQNWWVNDNSITLTWSRSF